MSIAKHKQTHLQVVCLRLKDRLVLNYHKLQTAVGPEITNLCFTRLHSFDSAKAKYRESLFHDVGCCFTQQQTTRVHTHNLSCKHVHISSLKSMQ